MKFLSILLIVSLSACASGTFKPINPNYLQKEDQVCHSDYWKISGPEFDKRQIDFQYASEREDVTSQCIEKLLFIGIQNCRAAGGCNN